MKNGNGNGGPGSFTPEGPVLQSKKFAAFLVAEATWKILAALVLFWGRDSITTQVWVILLAIIVVAGFVEVGYIVGQQALDKYVRVAQIAADAGQTIKMKGVETQKTPDGKPGELG